MQGVKHYSSVYPDVRLEIFFFSFKLSPIISFLLIFTNKSGPNLGPWAQKSTLRIMRTLGPSLVALAQSSWILLSNTLGG